MMGNPINSTNTEINEDGLVVRAASGKWNPILPPSHTVWQARIYEKLWKSNQSVT